MFRQRNELHVEEVEIWQKQFSLSTYDLTLLYIKAVLTIRKRALSTLSGVTVTAVVHRTLFECKEKFPVLEDIANDSNGLDFGKFIDQLNRNNPELAQKALQELLVVLLDVFGKITADILTKYLHQALMNVSPTSPPIDAESQTMILLSLAKNRDQK